MSELRFDAAKHRYTHGGIVVPSVTQVLKLLGGYEGIPRHILDTAARRGQAVHYATELADAGTLDWGSLPDELLGYLEAWEQFKADAQPTFIATERRLYHPLLGYAGTLDRAAIMRAKRWLLDIKTTAKHMPSTGPQTAAYLQAWNQGCDKADRLDKRGSVLLRADGTYDFKPYNSPADMATFTSCLNIFNWKQTHDRQH